MIQVVDTAHIIDSEELEDVVHTGYHLPIWRVAKGIGVVRELEDHIIRCILHRIVLVGELSPDSLHGYILAPLQLLDERNAVEKLAVHIPGYRPEELAVAQELPVFHHTDGCLLLEDGEVDWWLYEHGEWNLVPLHLAHDVEVHISEAAQPLALVDAQGGEVALILTAHESVQTHRMAEGELRTVEIDRQSLLLGVDIGNTRVVVDAHRSLGGADLLHFLARVHLEIMQVAHGAVALPSHSRIESESPVGLIDEAELLSLVEIHLVLRSGTDGHEEVILVVQQVVIGWRCNIVTNLEDELAHREFERTVLFLVERIGEEMTVVPVVTLRTVGAISIPEEVRIECRHSSGCQTQAHAIHVVIGEEGVDRSEVEEALSAILSSASYLYIVLHERLDAEDDVLESLGILHAVDEAVHRRLTLGEIHLSVLVPVGLISVHRIHIMPYLRLALEEHLRQRVEGVIGDSGVAHHQQILQQLVHVHLCYHIILGEHPLAIVELGVFLLYLHILHPVDG